MKTQTVPDKIKKYREVNRLSQAALGKLLEVDGSYISQLESGKKKPGMILMRLSRLTKGFITVDEVFKYIS